MANTKEHQTKPVHVLTIGYVASPVRKYGNSTGARISTHQNSNPITVYEYITHWLVNLIINHPSTQMVDTATQMIGRGFE